MEAQATKGEGAMNISFVVGIHESVNSIDGIFLKQKILTQCPGSGQSGGSQCSCPQCPISDEMFLEQKICDEIDFSRDLKLEVGFLFMRPARRHPSKCRVRPPGCSGPRQGNGL